MGIEAYMPYNIYTPEIDIRSIRFLVEIEVDGRPIKIRNPADYLLGSPSDPMKIIGLVSIALALVILIQSSIYIYQICFE